METVTAAGAAHDPDREEAYALFRAGRARSGNSALLLIGTLVLFGLVALPERSAVDVVVVTGVLLLHEFGHWLAMRLSGYRDTSIFFIPLVGAATSGRSSDGSPAKEGMVLLAGPIPGLILAIPVLILGTAMHQEWLTRGGYALLGINAFNLLPLVPLDGGRLFELALFGRHPLLEAGFRLCTLAGLCVLAVWLKNFVLVMLAAFMLGGLPVLIKIRSQRDRLRGVVSADVPPAELAPEQVDALFQAAGELERGLPVRPRARSRLMLHLHDALRRRDPSARTALALLGGWLAGVALVVIALLSAILTRRLAG